MSLSFRRHRATVTVAARTDEQRVRDAAASAYGLLAEVAPDLPEHERIALFTELMRLSPALAVPAAGPVDSERAHRRQRAERATESILAELMAGAGSGWTFAPPANERAKAVA